MLGPREFTHVLEFSVGALAWLEHERALTFDERGELLSVVEGEGNSVSPEPGPCVVHNHPAWATAWFSEMDVAWFLVHQPVVEEIVVISGNGTHYARLWLRYPKDAIDALDGDLGEFLEGAAESHRSADPRDLRRWGFRWELGWRVDTEDLDWRSILGAMPIHIPLHRKEAPF